MTTGVASKRHNTSISLEWKKVTELRLFIIFLLHQVAVHLFSFSLSFALFPVGTNQFNKENTEDSLLIIFQVCNLFALRITNHFYFPIVVY